MTIFAVLRPTYDSGTVISKAYRFTAAEMGFVLYRGDLFFGSYKLSNSVLWSSHNESSNANAQTIVGTASPSLRSLRVCARYAMSGPEICCAAIRVQRRRLATVGSDHACS